MASIKYWPLLAISFSTLIWIVAAPSDVRPRVLLNTVKMQGDNVTLTLHSDGYYLNDEEEWHRWMRCVPSDCDRVGDCIAIDYTSNSTKYQQVPQNLTQDIVSYQLTIFGALLQDAGMYTFSDNTPYFGMYSAEVIILESDPQCTRNTTDGDAAFEGDVVVMSCQVRYQGHWAPVMVWHDNGSNMNDIVNETVISTRNASGLAKYTAVVVASRALNGSVYSVKTTFRPTGIINWWGWDFRSDDYQYEDSYGPRYFAANTPPYTHNHRFPPLEVKHSVKVAKKCSRGRNAGGKHNDSVVIVAALIPSVLLIICSTALAFSLRKYRRLSANQRLQSRGISTNVETTTTASVGTHHEDADTTQLPHEPLGLNPVSKDNLLAATGESSFHDNMGLVSE